MFRTRKQSTTTYPLSVLMVSSTDHSTPQTGKTVTCTLSKNGGAFASSAGSVSELSSGIYTLAGNATDRNTLGSLIAKFSASGCDDSFVELEIVPYDVFSVVDANLTQIASATAAVSGSGSVTFLRGQTVANGSNFPTGFSLLQLEPVEGVYYIFDNPNGFSLATSALANIGNQVLSSLGTSGGLDSQLDAILAGGSGGADSDEVAAAVVAALAGSAVNVSSLVVARGVMQLVAGDKYTTDRMQPFTRTGWTGEDLDSRDGKMLFIPLATYNENSNEDAATLVVEGTFSQTGSTVTMNFPMSAAQTLTLNPARSGKGVTEYKVQVRANDPINETVWLGRAEVSRGITE